MLTGLKAVRRRASAGTLRAGRNIIRGATGRAYDLEALPIARVRGLTETPAVYIYARDLSSRSAHQLGHDATIEHYALGYIDQTADMSEAAATHEGEQHFRGHDFDVVLLVRIEQAAIRKEIVEDLIAQHRPVLNDLLGGHETARRV